MRSGLFQRRHYVAALCWMIISHAQAAADTVVIVEGAPGETIYASTFAEWVERWESAASTNNNVRVVHAVVEPDPDATTLDAGSTTQLDRLQLIIGELKESTPDRLWIVLIGHGTDDGRASNFNLVGPDLSAEQLDEWLEPLATPVAVIHCGAASSRFVDSLSRPGRIVITATRSPSEVNFARFGDALSSSIEGVDGDFDKDGQTSLLEAFLRASRLTRQFYEGDSRLTTEHALIDDNGDGRGTAAEQFADQSHVVLNDPSLDGMLASQWCLVLAPEEQWLTPELRERCDSLETALRDLRARRNELDEDAYYTEIELLLLEIAELYDGSGP